MRKKLSVIVPVYQIEQYLPRCVASIRSQDYPNLEIILVDDGSKDGSGRLCDAYAAEDPRIRVIHKENGGLSSARNAGIDIAEGDYLAFVDSDDYLEPNVYTPMIDLMEQYHAPLAVGGRYDVNFGEDIQTPGLCPPRTECITGRELVERIFRWDGCDSAAWDKVYDAGLFRNRRYPEGKICEDVPVTYLLALEAGKIVLYDRPIYNYYHRPGSITTAALSEKSFHLTEHTEAICLRIAEHDPALSSAARYLRVKTLSHILITLDQADGESRKRFAAKARHNRRELRRHLAFFLRDPGFGRTEKLRNMLLCLGLYRLLRPIFTHDKAV